MWAIKNYCWIWIAVDRLGKRFIHVATDYWKAYEAFIPQDRHIQSKAETFTVEGYNNLFRHFLARLRLSVMLLMTKWNGELEDILN